SGGLPVDSAGNLEDMPTVPADTASTTDLTSDASASRSMIIGGGFWWWRPSKPQVVVTVYDVSDAATPAKVSTTTFDGSLDDSRDISGRVYLVLGESINLPSPLFVVADSSPAGDQTNLNTDAAGVIPIN